MWMGERKKRREEKRSKREKEENEERKEKGRDIQIPNSFNWVDSTLHSYLPLKSPNLPPSTTTQNLLP